VAVSERKREAGSEESRILKGGVNSPGRIEPALSCGEGGRFLAYGDLLLLVCVTVLWYWYKLCDSIEPGIIEF
jgi:hypothetical protein